MPNPDFTGSVPRMRCETCQHWFKQGTARVGQCTQAASAIACGRPNVTPVVLTADLAVCSDWERAASVVE